MGRRILASLLSMALIFALPVFSLADDSTANLKNSGSVVNSVASTAESTEISMKAMRSVAASEGVSLTAAEGDSGQFGYNIEPFDDYYHSDIVQFDWGLQYQFYYYFPAGDYSFSFSSDKRIDVVGLNKVDPHISVESAYANSSTYQFNFSISEPSLYYLLFNFRTSDLPVSFVNLQGSSLIPVEGISSGYTYSSGVLDPDDRDKFSSFTASFGDQPAGKYLINIYHWGDNYKVNFDISDANDQYSLPTSTIGGVTTTVYNHPGGTFSLSGDFSASNDVTPYVEGYVYGSVDGSFTGKLQADSSLSWVFNITDIVAIPYETAADHNFGFFAPIIGFFNDHFSSMKSWIATQIDKIAGDDETQADVDQAQDSLNKEVEELGQLSTDLTTQTGNLEQQFTTDFAIPSEVLGQTGAVQQIYNFLFSSLGIFSIFIWLPVVLAVIKKLLRL